MMLCAWVPYAYRKDQIASCRQKPVDLHGVLYSNQQDTVKCTSPTLLQSVQEDFEHCNHWLYIEDAGIFNSVLSRFVKSSHGL